MVLVVVVVVVCCLLLLVLLCSTLSAFSVRDQAGDVKLLGRTQERGAATGHDALLCAAGGQGKQRYPLVFGVFGLRALGCLGC